jgi:hypothetical protein
LSRDGFFDWPLEGWWEWAGGNNGELYGKRWEVYGIIKKVYGNKLEPHGILDKVCGNAAGGNLVTELDLEIGN